MTRDTMQNVFWQTDWSISSSYRVRPPYAPPADCDSRLLCFPPLTPDSRCYQMVCSPSNISPSSVFHYSCNKRVRPLRGRPLWGRPCSWVRTDVAMVTRSPGARGRGFLMTPAKYVNYIRESTNQHLEILLMRLTLTQLLCPVTLTFDPLTLKLVHGVLVSQGPFLPSLVFVGLFVFPLGGGTGQTDRRTASIHNGASF